MDAGKAIAMAMAFAALAAASASDVRLEDLEEHWFSETRHGFRMKAKKSAKGTPLKVGGMPGGTCFDKDVQDIRDFAWMNEIEENRPLKPAESGR